MSNYKYQNKASEIILKNLVSSKYEACILAAAPGAGKTTISHKIINNYLKLFKNANVVVLTHGQNVLKNQYINDLKNPKTEINFSFGEFGSNCQVEIGLPQSIKNLSFDKVDLLVVDECHEFYLEEMVQNIVNKFKPKHQVLLTGSSSEFNYLQQTGQKNYFIHYIAGEDLVDNDIFSAVDMDVVRVLFKKSPTNSLREMLEHAKRKNKDLSKIMIAVKNINDAKCAESYLKSIGYKVAMSTSQNDKDSELIEMFKLGVYNALVVVQKGILGFSDNNITGLFDLRCSSNVEVSNQLFSRVLRKHPKDVFKFYYRCAEKGSFNKEVIMLHKIKAMMRNDIFKNYNGNNLEVKVG